jgi:hypothetical protein
LTSLRRSCTSCCSTAPVDVDRRRRCRDSTPVVRRATRGCATPADLPKVEEIIAVMRAAGDNPHGRRLRALIVIVWRAGLRVHADLAPPTAFAAPHPGFDNAEIIDTVHARRQPMIPVSTAPRR